VRSLILSYFGAFALVIAVFAGAVRVSYLSIIERQITARLATLARAGTAMIEFTPGGYTVDTRSFGGFVVHTDSEGLQWFDAGKRLVASRGRVPARYVLPALGEARLAADSGTLDTYTVAIEDARGEVRGYVRAGQTIDALQQGTPALDLGLVAGSIVAIIAATLGGGALASAALRQREESFQELQEFTANASHELRTPLAAQANTAALALREAPDLPERTRRRLESVVAINGHMARLVDDLMILARATRSLEREMFAISVDAVLRRVTDVHHSFAAERSLELRVRPFEPFEILGNPDQIERIVSNLVENAIRYTEPGGAVDISCTSDESSVWIAVRDTGVGVPPEHRERIFDRFWRGDNVHDGAGGTGLGLAIARALARRHGGDVALTNATGSGSVFTLRLPRRPPPLS
jgi:signal transduction histidine kinase